MLSQKDPVGLSTRFTSAQTAQSLSTKSECLLSKPIPPSPYSRLPQYGGLVMQQSNVSAGRLLNTSRASPAT